MDDNGIKIKETFALAVQNHQKNNLEVAENLYKEVLNANPTHEASHYNLGNVLKELGKYQKAISCYEKAIQINPLHSGVYINLGTVFKQLGEFQNAINCYEKAIQINPNFAGAHNNLGLLFQELGKLQKAKNSCQKAIQIQPNYAEAHSNLGTTLQELGEHQKAILCYQKAIQIDSNCMGAHYNLGNAFKELGEYKKAISWYGKEIEIHPNYIKAYNNILFTLLYIEKVYSEYYLSQAKKFRSSLKPIHDDLLLKYQFDAKPKKLKIGFVSGDLHRHPVGYFLLDTLKHLKNKNLELVAYSNSRKKDSLSGKLKSQFTHWCEITDQSDKKVINQIRKDGIHILFDLSGHSAKNRLPIFINKPAPIQVSWAGYAGSTGIPEIDYLIGDSFVTPSNERNHFTEKIFLLPNIWVCFTTSDIEIKLDQLPAIKNGYITFGSFNNFSKINDRVISLWCKILSAMAGSKIFLKNKALNDSYFKKKIISDFKKNNISSDALILEGGSSRDELLASYNKVDIALDPFPYSGGVTSFEAIWMGVPVLTKKGSKFVSHATESINHNVNMLDWIANDENEYVKKAIEFSANLQQLSEIKKNLRKTALESPAFNASLFAEQLNTAVWKMWNNYISKN